MALDLLQQGIQAAREGKKTKAVHLLSKAVKKSPNSAQAWFYLGALLEDGEKASYCFERAFDLDPSMDADYLLLQPSTSSDLRLPELAPAPKPAPLHPFIPVNVEKLRPAVVLGGPDISDLRNPTQIPAATIPFSPVRVLESIQLQLDEGNDLNLESADAAPSSETNSQTPEPAVPPDGTALQKGGPDGWLKYAIIALSLLVVGVLAVGAYLYVRGLTNDARQPLAPQVQETHPEPTALPTNTPTLAALTNTPAPVPSSTPVPDATRIYQNLGFQITAAYNLVGSEQNSAACLQSYDRLLEQMPGWAVGLHDRAVCKRGNANYSHDLTGFIEDMTGAIQDLDQAIALNPSFANAYVERGFVYYDLAEAADNRTERNDILAVALENLRAGEKLNSTEDEFEAYIPLTLANMGRCQESVTEAKRMLSASSSDQTSNAALQNALALGHFCQGDYQRALETVEKSLENAASCEGYTVQAKILIAMGEEEDALKAINNCMSGSSLDGGYRYFLRALIYYDRGEKNQVDKDLASGASSTWLRGGLYAYLTGLRKMDEGNLEEARKLFLYADETWSDSEGSWLKQRIRQSLNSLKTASPATATPGLVFSVTPIPAHLTPEAAEPTTTGQSTQPVNTATLAPPSTGIPTQAP
jgi:tetratricopeptide (TPR) repeat protein